MVDFEKVYSIKFQTATAARNLATLRDVIHEIENNKLPSRLTTLAKTLGRVKKPIIDISKSLGRFQKASEKIENGKLGATVSKVATEMKKTEHSAKEASDAMARGFNRASRSVDSLKKRTALARREIEKTADRMRRVADGASVVGRKLTTFVTLPIIGAGVAALKFSRDFNAGMANVATLIPGQTARVMELRKSILQMSADSGKSLEDLTNGLYETISAYGDDTDTVKRLDVATKAALAGRAETLDAVKLLSAVTKAYGDTSGAAQEKVSDLAFMTVKLGQTTFPELAASMGKVTPLASALKTSQEELFSVFATLTGVTGGAAEVSTQLASVYRALLKPSEKMTEFSQKFGFENSVAMVKTLGLAKTIKLMGEYTKGDESAMLKMLRRGEALTAVLALTGGQADTFNQKLGEMGGAIGATEEAFKAQTEGVNEVGHSFEKTKQKLIGLAIRIGDRLLPVVDKILKKLEPLIKYFEDADDATLAWWGSLIKWAALLGPSIRILSTMAKPLIAINKYLKLAAINTNQVGDASVSNVPKVGGMTKALNGLQMALGAVVAGMAAYEAASAAMDLIVNPELSMQEKVLNSAIKTSDKARFLAAQDVDQARTVEENQRLITDQESQLKKTKMAQKEIGSQTNLGWLGLSGGLVGVGLSAYSAVTGPSRGEQIKQEKDLAAQESALSATLKRNRLLLEQQRRSEDRAFIPRAETQTAQGLQQKAAAPSRKMRQQKRGAAPLPPSNINITVNAKSDNHRGIARETAKKFREVERDLRRTGDGISESEF